MKKTLSSPLTFSISVPLSSRLQSKNGMGVMNMNMNVHRMMITNNYYSINSNSKIAGMASSEGTAAFFTKHPSLSPNIITRPHNPLPWHLSPFGFSAYNTSHREPDHQRALYVTLFIFILFHSFILSFSFFHSHSFSFIFIHLFLTWIV